MYIVFSLIVRYLNQQLDCIIKSAEECSDRLDAASLESCDELAGVDSDHVRYAVFIKYFYRSTLHVNDG